MNVINRYLAAQVLMGLGIATVVLLPLFGFLDLLDQLDDVGRGTYRVQDAFLHTALLLPRRFIQLAPFIALLGNVIALGRLAVGSELTALRVAGVSPNWYQSARRSRLDCSFWCLLLRWISSLPRNFNKRLYHPGLSRLRRALPWGKTWAYGHAMNAIYYV